MKKLIALKNITTSLIAVFMLVAVILGAYFIGSTFSKKPKEFDTGLGLTITLTNQFEEFDDPDVDYAVASNDVAFGVERVLFRTYDNLGYNTDTMTALEFAQIQIVAGGYTCTAQNDTENDLVYFQYSKMIDGDRYKYTIYSFRSTNCFYLCQFVVEDDEYIKYQDKIVEWAKSIEYEKGEVTNIVSQTFTSTYMPVTVTLTNQFSVYQSDSEYYYLYTNTDLIFMTERATFALLENYGWDTDATTADVYAQAIIDGNNLNSSLVSDYENNLVYFDYTSSVQGTSYYYLAFSFKGTDSFYLCQFSCIASESEANYEQFMTWAKTIVVG